MQSMFIENINSETSNTICHMARNSTLKQAHLVGKSYTYEQIMLPGKTPPLPHTEAKSME